VLLYISVCDNPLQNEVYFSYCIPFQYLFFSNRYHHYHYHRHYYHYHHQINHHYHLHHHHHHHRHHHRHYHNQHHLVFYIYSFSAWAIRNTPPPAPNRARSTANCKARSTIWFKARSTVSSEAQSFHTSVPRSTTSRETSYTPTGEAQSTLVCLLPAMLYPKLFASLCQIHILCYHRRPIHPYQCTFNESRSTATRQGSFTPPSEARSTAMSETSFTASSKARSTTISLLPPNPDCQRGKSEHIRAVRRRMSELWEWS